MLTEKSINIEAPVICGMSYMYEMKEKGMRAISISDTLVDVTLIALIYFLTAEKLRPVLMRSQYKGFRGIW